MKLFKWLLLISVCLLIVYQLLRHKDHSPGQETRVLTEQGHSLGRENPFWTEQDLETSKLDPKTLVRSATATITYHKQPPFFAGKLPIEYEIEIANIVPEGFLAHTPGGTGIVVIQEFVDFTTFYVYGSSLDEKLRGIPIGAVTLAKSSHQAVAQARVVTPRYPADQTDGVLIEEQHLGDCNDDGCSLIFGAMSKIDKLGLKITENEVRGKKDKDYYLAWPMQTH